MSFVLYKGGYHAALAIIGAFCGPRTLQGLLDRLDDDDAERATASIPFLLTLRRLQDALYDIDRAGKRAE